MTFTTTSRGLYLGIRRRGLKGVAFTPPASNPPVNTLAPAISGTPRVPNVLTSTTGTWTNTPTAFVYAWFSGGVLIASATVSSYTLQATDIGNTINCSVTASNSDGAATSTSNSLGPVLAPLAPPVNTVAPVITGNPIEAFVLTATTGSWTNSPTSYTYQWKRGAINVGSNSLTYTLVAADAASNITCVVTAVNSDGSNPATSNAIGPIESTASLWTPASNANCVFNFDAAKAASVTQTGGIVDQWVDADARASIVAAQSNATFKPTYSAAGDPTGRAMITFAGGQHLFGTFTFNPVNLTCYAVGAMNSATASSGRLVSIASSGGDNNNLASFAAIMRATLAQSIRAIYNGTNAASSSIVYGAKCIMASKASDTGINTGVNCVDQTEVAILNTFNAIRYAFGTAAAGGNTYSATLFWDGWANQIVLFNAILTAAEEAKLQGYLSWHNWGDGTPLPSGHTYKNRPPPG